MPESAEGAVHQVDGGSQVGHVRGAVAGAGELRGGGQRRGHPFMGTVGVMTSMLAGAGGVPGHKGPRNPPPFMSADALMLMVRAEAQRPQKP